MVFAKPNDVTIPTEAETLKGKSSLEVFKYYVKSQKYIMHAGGSINKTYYTNSFEAIDKNYQDGNRIRGWRHVGGAINQLDDVFIAKIPYNR